MAESRRPIRPAREADAEAISRVIVQTLRLSNAADYPPQVIERVAANFDAAGVRGLLESRQVFVALDDERVVATASLAGDVVRSVFVLPEMQGRGVGKALMRYIEGVARAAGVQLLRVPASLTAVPFYAALGYTVIREVVEGDERTQVMAREL
ncbi:MULTISPECIES: GNAT family N-acetyltransferase [Pseudomonas]|jgi:GNAT superfamily N-acetyltransferase|uniref:GCN5-related N-acetyltransferase n=1 Tax=Pseudomonas fulva (strain 12-X) TaxID=743720 RepID=F6AJ54_PSEF1|nr:MULTISPECIES: GNAT family N-acetyltransferase [Pseudomonas]AEF24007.1 GCN5-related N-acetyltransferase [Pseudomonas fulva 12-X]PZW70260.1 acetyltransferase (GNAT) family protein [Pseudomonas sp. URMO17WK12:I1]